MSEILPSGIMEASDWVGVASEMVDYLENWLKGNTGEVPIGTFEDAESFFHQVLQGIDPEEKPTGYGAPRMAAISNLTLAEGVFYAMHSDRREYEALEEIKQKVRRYIGCLSEIRSGTVQDETLQCAVSMKDFFVELWRQGNQNREAAFFRASEY